MKMAGEAGVRREDEETEIEAERNKREESEARKSYARPSAGGRTCEEQQEQSCARCDNENNRSQAAELTTTTAVMRLT